MKEKQNKYVQVEKKLVDESYVDISLSASTILNAYHARETQKATEPVSIPLHKRLSFRLGLSAALLVVVSVSVSVPLILAYENKGTTRIYSVPALTSSSKKLMFEANNLSGCLSLDSLKSLQNPAGFKAIMPLYASDDDDDDSIDDSSESESNDDESSSSESEDAALNLTMNDCESLAKTYHSLFALLNKSSDTNGSFTKEGDKYIYASPFGSTLSLDDDPNNLPSSFGASLSKGSLLYGLNGSYSDKLLSFDVSSDSGAKIGTYKEEINALRNNRRKFSFSTTDSTSAKTIYFDADFEDGSELDVEMGINKYENGLLKEKMEFESEFEDSSYKIEYSYDDGTHEYEELEFTAKVEGSSTVYVFDKPSFSFTLDNL